jgi:hypothetical protein
MQSPYPLLLPGECAVLLQLVRARFFEQLRWGYTATRYARRAFEAKQLGLKELPASAALLTDIEWLDLSKNPELDLQQVVKMAAHWPKLTMVQLELNQYSTFPETILQIPTIQKLLLSRNSFEELPTHIGHPALNTLVIDFYGRTPESLDQFRQQNTHINLTDNRHDIWPYY